MPSGKASGWSSDSGAGYGLTRRAAPGIIGTGAGEVMGVDQGPGVWVLEDPLTNKGTAFSEEERSALGLRGLLPAVVETLEQQVRRRYQAYQEQPTDVARHINLRALQDTNEMLFYRLVSDHIEEMLPVLYTPTVGLACQRFSEIYRRPRGLFIAYPDRDRIGEILRNRPRREVDVIVVTDGQRILGLGDQGIGGMGIPIGKLSLYAALGGIDPARTLPVLLDVGTDNAGLLDDPMYLGWRHRRIAGAGYDDFVDRFVQAVRAELPGVLLQWEDFATPHALPILERYRDQLLSFNDDIQGTAAVVLAALSAGAAATGSRLRDQMVVMLGAGSAGIGVCEQVVRSMVADGLSERGARARICVLDVNGLLTTDRPDLEPGAAPSGPAAGRRARHRTWPASRPHRRDRRCAPDRAHRPVHRRRGLHRTGRAPRRRARQAADHHAAVQPDQPQRGPAARSRRLDRRPRAGRRRIPVPADAGRRRQHPRRPVQQHLHLPRSRPGRDRRARNPHHRRHDDRGCRRRR